MGKVLLSWQMVPKNDINPPRHSALCMMMAQYPLSEGMCRVFDISAFPDTDMRPSTVPRANCRLFSKYTAHVCIQLVLAVATPHPCGAKLAHTLVLGYPLKKWRYQWCQSVLDCNMSHERMD